MSEAVTTRGSGGIDEAAGRLLAAAASGEPCAPVRDLIGTDDVRSAYAVQGRVIAAHLESGMAAVVGRKIGLTSAVVQEQLGVGQPDFGVLLDTMAFGDGATVPVVRFLQPRVEAEVAFVLKRDLEGGLGLEQVRAGIDYAVAALEICDSRIAGWDISLGDTVADNASAGAFVLGTQHRCLDAFEPGGVTMSMTVTGQEGAVGTGAACLGDPLVALQWLARRARDFGEPLRAGQVILSGALGPMRPVAPGAEVAATITGLGVVSCTFTREHA